MIVPTKAIVLRSTRYSEADLIVKCYTASDGLKSYMVRGVLKTKKGRIKAVMFQPFSQLELIAKHKNKGTLEYIKEAKITNINISIRENVRKSSIAIFLSEIVQNAIQEEEKNQPLFDFIENAIDWLENHDKFANFHLFFLVHLTRYLGIFPHFRSEDDTFFNVKEGHSEATESDRYSIGGQNCGLLKTLLKIDLGNLTDLKANQEIRNKFLIFMISYYQFQLSGFKSPKSLEVLGQLF